MWRSWKCLWTDGPTVESRRYTPNYKKKKNDHYKNKTMFERGRWRDHNCKPMILSDMHTYTEQLMINSDQSSIYLIFLFFIFLRVYYFFFKTQSLESCDVGSGSDYKIQKNLLFISVNMWRFIFIHKNISEWILIRECTIVVGHRHRARNLDRSFFF